MSKLAWIIVIVLLVFIFLPQVPQQVASTVGLSIPSIGGTTTPTTTYAPSDAICTDSDCTTLPSDQQSIGDVGTIFVTSNSYGGGLGGIAGADTKCQDSAIDAGLSGTWIAIISDASTDAIDRISDGTYIRMDGAQVAGSKPDLFDGGILHSISIDEYGTVLLAPYNVWTGSDEGGEGFSDAYMSCKNWVYSDINLQGVYGDTSEVTGKWIFVDSMECNQQNRLYCIRSS